MTEEIKKSWFVRHKIITAMMVLIGLGLISIIASGNDSAKSTVSNNSTAPTSNHSQVQETEVKKEKEPEIPAEYKSALNKATTYSSTMHMSKKGVYNQLVSEYGEKFTAEAAQYAIDNIKADWNANALAKAKTYQDTMSMSPAAIHTQLTSEAGEKFTKSEADYAIAHLND